MAFFPRLQMRFLLPLLSLIAMDAQAAGEEVGSKACSGCHAEIYRTYSTTSMFRSSGKAGAASPSESFDHANLSELGAEYRILPAADGYRLEFSRVDSGA